MPQPPPKPWKKTAFAAIALLEHAMRGGNAPSQAALQQIKTFLVLQYDAPLGSVVHATPLFEALKRAVPDAHITVAASSMTASVLGHNPYIDRLIVTPNPFNNFRNAGRAIRGLLRSTPKGPRCILTTIGNRRPRIALLSLLAGRSVRAGHTAAPELYDIPLTFLPEHGQIEGNLDILRSLGHDVPFSEPRIFFTQQDADYAARLLDHPNVKSDSPRIAFVTQNSGGQRNQWSSDRFQQVIAILTQTCAATPVFVGIAADSAAIEELQRSLPGHTDRGISVAGKTTVSQLAAVLAQCDLTVSLDTGAFHVTRAVALPGVVMAPAWQNPLEWLPVDHSRYRVLRGPSITSLTAGYCMEEISVEQVIGAAIELMGNFPASIDARRARVERAVPKRRTNSLSS